MFLDKLLKNNSGFSIVEIMVAAGLLGVVSLGAMQMMNNVQKGQATSETKLEELELRRVITTILTDKTACLNSLNGVNVGSTFEQIRNSANTVVFEKDGIYGNGTVRLRNMIVMDKGVTYADGTRDVNLIVGLQKVKQMALGGDVVNFKLDVRVLADSATGPITGCFVDSDSIIQQACETLGGTWTGSSCELPKCAPGQLLEAILPNGTPVCRSPNCAAGYVFRAFDTNGNPLCERLNVYQ